MPHSVPVKKLERIHIVESPRAANEEALLGGKARYKVVCAVRPHLRKPHKNTWFSPFLWIHFQ